MAKKRKSRFDKYELYESSVQGAEDDVVFLSRLFQKEKKRKPLSLREDFCGTFLFCTEWVKSHPERTAVGVDISKVPTGYGMRKHYTSLTDDQRQRLRVLNQDVRKAESEPVDFICALNFSYFIFKTRDQLRDYFAAARKSIGKDGLLMVDHFGGPANMQTQSEARYCETPDGKKFRYYWDQATFNPVSSESMFHIHFLTPDRVRMNKAFTYDWRMWSIAEIRELMLEAGFKSTKVYWEFGGEDFKPTEKGEDDCDVWICYILGLV